MKRNECMELFMGPCVLESDGLVDEIAAYLKENIVNKFTNEVNFYFKGSFDKANRTAIDSYRGPGIEKGLQMLEQVRKKYGMKVITDFHTPDQAEEVGSVVDVLQVPAFLCRQTDMIAAGATSAKKYGRILKVKKGQFISPDDAKNIVDKAKTILPLDKIMLTERGSTFGYNNLIVDMASFAIMKSFGVKAIHDATHCVQRPGGFGKSTGGKRDQIFLLAKAAIVSGADGIFIETHPRPSEALSDSATSMPLDKSVLVISELINLYKFVQGQKEVVL